MNSQLTIIFGIVLDVIVCTFFAWRLMQKHRDDPTNVLIKFFIPFFWILDLLLFSTLLYVPGLVIPKDSFLIFVFFSLAFFFMYVVSAYAAKIIMLVKFPGLNHDRFFWPLISFGAISAIFFNFFYQSRVTQVVGGYSIAISTPQIILMAIPMTVTFVFASYIFTRQAVKEKEGRTRSALLGLAFILWLIGGATHVITLTYGLSVISDIVTSLGFVAAFVALIKSPARSQG